MYWRHLIGSSKTRPVVYFPVLFIGQDMSPASGADGTDSCPLLFLTLSLWIDVLDLFSVAFLYIYLC